MIESMTGFGQAEKTENGVTISIETRSVNNRFLEIFIKSPQSISSKENELKEIIRENFSRGKINVQISISKNSGSELKIDNDRAKKYFQLLKKLNKSIGSKDEVSLSDLLRFTDIFEIEKDEFDEKNWDFFNKTFRSALTNLKKMRVNEGESLKKDLLLRVALVDKLLNKIEKISALSIKEQKNSLAEKISKIVNDKNLINSQRVEMEILLLTDKLDVTEEIVRFKTHNKYFVEALNNENSQGRKLNFLIQEMNREANTIGSKSSDVKIAHFVVQIKEELEKIREQLQNIE